MDAWSIKTLVGEREETLIDRAEISKKEWRDARNWNRKHPKSDGRYVAAVSPGRRVIHMVYLSRGAFLQPGWTETTFPRENGKTVSHRAIDYDTGHETRKSVPLEWVS